METDLGPWVMIAGIAEAVAIAENGQVFGAQLFDGIDIDRSVPWDRTTPGQLVLRVAGGPPGGHVVEVTAALGNHDFGLIAEMKLAQPDESGIGSSHAEINIPVDRPGTIWFSVSIDGLMRSRFPFRIRHFMGGIG